MSAEIWLIKQGALSFGEPMEVIVTCSRDNGIVKIVPKAAPLRIICRELKALRCKITPIMHVLRSRDNYSLPLGRLLAEALALTSQFFAC